MARSTGSTRASAQLALGVLATMAGLLFAGTGLEAEPMVEARSSAEQVAAFRLAVDPDASPARRVPEAPSSDRFPLLHDTDVVRLASSATHVRVPSVGIDAEVRPVGLVFRDGRLQYDVPSREAGQYAGTGTLGEPGNTVIGGHVASRGGVAVFSALPNVTVGALIEVSRGDEVFQYQVTEVRVVAPDATTVMEPTQDATLTLITCSTDSARANRVVVVGKPL
ncbi:MAG: sortase [Dehalococcoidia bacterium]